MKQPKTADDYRDLILQFAASFTLADHLGDVSEDVGQLLVRIGIADDWDDQDDLRELLAGMGVKTIYGTGIGGER